MIELRPLQNQVKHLVDDLRGQVASHDDLRAALLAEYGDARAAQRIDGTFETWLEDALDQAAVAWVLGCVLVRFCEDNELVDAVWLGGPETATSVEAAIDARQAYLIANPRHNDRHWLREAFGYLKGLGATGRIFDTHNPVWRFDISGEAAEQLSDFFRRGAGYASLRNDGLDTRFLGDLYQDLSAHARKTYALLQTPEFVEEFILDRTFEPAVKEFGLAKMKVIDPTCGSGHFLLGAFARLVRLWTEREPASDIRELTQRALDQVTGVDINPFAVAIARFRLMVAALNACGLTSLEKAPVFELRVAAGDSLLAWGEKSRHQGDLLARAEGPSEFAYFTEDGDLLGRYLQPNSYTVVVGNPPYIKERDKVRKREYKKLYKSCYGAWTLNVPFTERMFTLAKLGDHDGDDAGYVGSITSNNFIAREFGKRLIENYLTTRIDLNEIVDTSGVTIPGHNATIILIGKNRMPSGRYSGQIRVAMGGKREPQRLAEPETGRVWKAILEQIDSPGTRSEWLTVSNVPRERFADHPWNLSGDGSGTLKMRIESVHSAQRLSMMVDRVGLFGASHEDAFFFADPMHASRQRLDVHTMPATRGDACRDWFTTVDEVSIFPYSDANYRIMPEQELDKTFLQYGWPYRTLLWARQSSSGKTYREAQMPWYSWHQINRQRNGSERVIAFAETVTHNHFSLANGQVAFNQSAPIISCTEDANESDCMALLGILNSSTTCYWLRHTCFPKGGSGAGRRGIQSEDWMERYVFNSKNVAKIPVPASNGGFLAGRLTRLADDLAAVAPNAIASSCTPTRQTMARAKKKWEFFRSQMIALQEEIDWQTYADYELIERELVTSAPPPIRLGERAFEIVLAAAETNTRWFERNSSTPVMEIPSAWPEEYRRLVNERISTISSNEDISLIELPEYKRRWATNGWDKLQERALRGWLLNQLESETIWGSAPTPLSVRQLSDRMRHNDDFRSVLDLWVGHDQHDLVKTLGELIAEDYVPFLSAYRYKATGLRKRAQWERTWTLQRQEDAGKAVDIAIPPRYKSEDFVKMSFWRHRDELDIPRERFIAYSQASQDGTELIGWAGWDHLAQAQALATVYIDRKTQAAWPAERLLPLLAGIAELEPWLHQWYAEARPDFPGTPAEFFTGLIDTELSTLGADRATLTKLRGLEELS